MSDLNIDPKRVAAAFGGPTETWRRLTKAGFNLTLQAVEKWIERGNIPANRIAQLALCAREDGRKFDIYTMVSGQTPQASKRKPKKKNQ